MKKNILSDPGEWAGRAVGTSLRYRVMQLFTVLLGLLLALTFYSLCGEGEVPPEQLVAFLVMLGAVAILFPLCYLRALRFLLLTRKEGRQDG